MGVRTSKHTVIQIITVTLKIQRFCQRKLRFKDSFAVLKIQRLARGWLCRVLHPSVIFHLRAARGLRKGYSSPTHNVYLYVYILYLYTILYYTVRTCVFILLKRIQEKSLFTFFLTHFLSNKHRKDGGL